MYSLICDNAFVDESDGLQSEQTASCDLPWCIELNQPRDVILF